MKTRTTRRRRSRAFTLVELMVSLVAGLVIAIAVVGLAKATTTSFHEEARISTVEGSVRLAAERLRRDLSRIAYMSTGNIVLARDNNVTIPRLSVPIGQKIAVPNGFAAITGSRYPTFNNLAGLRIIVGGSGQYAIPGAGMQGPLNLATANGLNGDAIIVAGNYTTDDLYQGTLYAPMTLAGSCNGQSILLKKLGDAATRRLLNATDQLAAVRAAFMPVAGTRYGARVVDARGCQHYVVVCDVNLNTTECTGGAGDECAAIHLAPPPAGEAVLPRSDNCGAENLEIVSINPVHRFRYYIGPNIDGQTGMDEAGAENANNKFNLFREMLDAQDPPAPVVGSKEVVAEFAVDLKFGISVDDPALVAPNNMRVFDMDTDPGGGSGNIDVWTGPPTATLPNGPGPQRVRSVRFRVATRSAIPDRTGNLSLLPGTPYLSRYCTDPPACKAYARVRTIVSEVALTNQLSMTY